MVSKRLYPLSMWCFFVSFRVSARMLACLSFCSVNVCVLLLRLCLCLLLGITAVLSGSSYGGSRSILPGEGEPFTNRLVTSQRRSPMRIQGCHFLPLGSQSFPACDRRPPPKEVCSVVGIVCACLASSERSLYSSCCVSTCSGPPCGPTHCEFGGQDQEETLPIYPFPWRGEAIRASCVCISGVKILLAQS